MGAIVFFSPVAEGAITTDVLRITWRMSVGTSTNTGNQSTALGDQTVSTGYGSHSEGFQTYALGNSSHAEGALCWATNTHAHAEGFNTRAYGAQSHAEGHSTIARGSVSHAQGQFTEANASYSHSGGLYSRVPSSLTGAFIHAYGTSGNYKTAQYTNTAHFDRLYLFESSNDDSNSVLARWEADSRYLNTDGGDWVTNYLFVGDGTFNSGTSFTFYDNLPSTYAYHYTPVFVAREDSPSDRLTETKTGIVVYNDAGTTNSWAKLAFASREGAGSGNAVALAGIAAQKVTSTIGNWARGDLVFWTKNFFLEDERLRIVGSNGYVGVNTVAPTARLDVNGDARFVNGARVPASGDISMGAFTSGSL